MTPGPMSRPFRVSLQAWVALFLLGFSLWQSNAHAHLIIHVGVVLFGAILLSLAIHPLADKLARRGIPRGATVLLVYAAVGLLFVLMASLVSPIVKTEMGRLQTEGPDLVRSALTRLAAVPVLRQWVPSYDQLATSVVPNREGMLRPLAGTVVGAAEALLEVFILLVLTYFFVTDVGLGERMIRGWAPVRHRERALLIARDLEERLTRWVWAQAAIALYFAVVFSAGLALLHVPFGFTIGLIGGILEMVPYLGGAIAMLLAVFSALSVNGLLAVWVAVFYVVVVEVESHVIAPTFYGRIIGLHPAAVLVALLIGGRLHGILGVLFAVPVAVLLVALLEEIRARFILPEEEVPAADVSAGQPGPSSADSD